MHATSPTISQPHVRGVRAFGAALALAAAFTAGAVIAVNLPATTASPTDGGASAAAALKLQRAGEIGAMTSAQRSLLEQRKGEIHAGAAAAAGTVILNGAGEYRPDGFEAPGITVPVTPFRAGGVDGMAPWNQFPTLGGTIAAPVYSGKTIDPVSKAQDPDSNLSDYFGARTGWNVGNDTQVGISHR